MAATNVISTTPSFPVGSIFLTAAETNPSELLGYGTWELLSAGKMLMTAATKEEGLTTGGSNSKTISVNNLPSHTHTGPSHSHTIGNAGGHTHTTGGGACTAAANGAHSHVVNGGTCTAAANGAHGHNIRGTTLTTDNQGYHQIFKI